MSQTKVKTVDSPVAHSREVGQERDGDGRGDS